MKMAISRLLACSLATALLPAALQAADWGTLKGHLTYDGKAPAAKPIEPTKDPETCGKCNLVDQTLVVSPGGHLANVVIWLRTKPPAVNPDFEKTAKDKVDLDNKCCHFTPHVQMLRTTQTLIVKNSDPIGHNTNLQAVNNASANQLIPAGGDMSVTFPAEEGLPITVNCNIHPWMSAYVVVRSNPYMAVSDEKGDFTIKDLPAGKELEFQLWQEKAGYLKNVTFKKGKADSKGRFKLKLAASETDLGDMKVPAADFLK